MVDINETLDNVECPKCGTKNNYSLIPTDMSINLDNDTIILTEDIPYCNKCECRISVMEITNKIIKHAQCIHDTYNKINNEKGMNDESK